MVLPPNEGFSPEAVGAIGLMVQRLGADPKADFCPVVIGPALRHPPFATPYFQAAHPPPWLLASRTTRYVWGVAGRLRQLRPNLIEVHNRPMIALALARRFPDAATVLVLHNDPQAMRGTASAAGRARLRGLARVVTVSSYISERLMDGVADWSPLPSIQPNCIDLGAISPPLPQGQRDPVILFAGRLVPEKGVDSFVAACARALPGLPGWRAEVIGARRLRPGTVSNAFSNAVQRAAAAAGIQMTGYRSHIDVLAAMARAAIVVVPSRWPEPFGLTALEAMASGAALICSPRGNLPELVRDAAVLVDPDDVGALADAITALSQNVLRRAALGAAGRRRAQAFDIELGAAALNRLRREILGV